MYDLFFTENEGSIGGIDDHAIDFNLGKNDCNLKSIHNTDKKSANENYKRYFELPTNESDESAKEKIVKCQMISI